MKGVVFGVAGYAFASFFAMAAPDVSLSEESSSIQFNSKLQSVLSYTRQHPIDESVFNPDNRVARLAPSELDLELRPDFQLNASMFSLSLKPRARVGHISGGEFPAAEDKA